MERTLAYTGAKLITDCTADEYRPGLLHNRHKYWCFQSAVRGLNAAEPRGSGLGFNFEGKSHRSMLQEGN